MSQSYVFKFTVNLNTKIPEQDMVTIKYLFGDCAIKPDSFPDHTFFSNSAEISPFRFSYENSLKGSYIFDFWGDKDKSKSRYSMNLYIPSLKLEEIYEYYLPFISWLSTFGLSSGYAGSFSLESAEDFDPMLLFVFKNSIYLGDTHSAFSFLSGEKISFKELN